jgi:hypothetical protein
LFIKEKCPVRDRKGNVIKILRVRRKPTASLEAGGVRPRTIDFRQGPEYIALFTSILSPHN